MDIHLMDYKSSNLLNQRHQSPNLKAASYNEHDINNMNAFLKKQHDVPKSKKSPDTNEMFNVLNAYYYEKTDGVLNKAQLDKKLEFLLKKDVEYKVSKYKQTFESKLHDIQIELSREAFHLYNQGGQTEPGSPAPLPSDARQEGQKAATQPAVPAPQNLPSSHGNVDNQPPAPAQAFKTQQDESNAAITPTAPAFEKQQPHSSDESLFNSTDQTTSSYPLAATIGQAINLLI